MMPGRWQEGRCRHFRSCSLHVHVFTVASLRAGQERSMVKVGQGGTQKWCPSCEAVRVCTAVSLASFGVASNQRRYFRNHSDIQWFRRALICQKCGHQWLTAELPEEFLNELVQLRNALKEVKANAEAYIQESERAADGLKRLSASLSALRALNVYEKE